MKPFSVSVSQDFLGMAKIGRVNIHYSIIRIYHTFRFWIPKDCHLSTTNLPLSISPLGTAAGRYRLRTSATGCQGWDVKSLSRMEHHGISGWVKPQTLHFFWGVTYNWVVATQTCVLFSPLFGFFGERKMNKNIGVS